MVHGAADRGHSSMCYIATLIGEVKVKGEALGANFGDPNGDLDDILELGHAEKVGLHTHSWPA